MVTVVVLLAGAAAVTAVVEAEAAAEVEAGVLAAGAEAAAGVPTLAAGVAALLALGLGTAFFRAALLSLTAAPVKVNRATNQ